MKNKLVTVTIGMPAYNEADNIAYVLEDIFKQKQDGFVIEKVIVASDGSSDSTCDIVRGVSDPRIVLFDNADRGGVSVRQNQIVRESTSDVLVLINADIAMPDEHFISNLIKPVIFDGADLTSCKLSGVVPRTFVERIINASVEVKLHLYESINHGNCVYTCYGAARAFSHKYYSQITFGDSVGEDAYSYLKAVHDGFVYKYVSETFFYIRLPSTLKDHFRQSVRYNQSRERFISEFGLDFVLREYAIPFSAYIKALIYTITHCPILIVMYMGIFGMSSARSLFAHKISPTWDIATGTKKLR